MLEFRICTGCDALLSIGAFHKRKKSKSGFRSRCKECCKKAFLADYAAIYRAEWYKINIDKEKANIAKWRAANTGKVNAINAKRRAAKLNATPCWLTKEQLLEIQWYYDTAKELQWLSEEPLEVDHVVPLQGKDVSGLHVPWNLQILPESLNCSKGNKYGP